MGACMCRNDTSSGDTNNGDPTHDTAPATTSNTTQQPQPVVQQETYPLPLPLSEGRVPVIPMFLTPGADDPDNILGRPFEDVLSHFTIGEVLGRCRFGVMYLCRERATGHWFACKSTSKRKLRDERDRDEVRREINILHYLNGQPNILEFKGAYEDANSVHLVMELCAGGELLDRVVDEVYYTERSALGIFRIIINVVDVCHSRGVMHRDLNPENFLLTTKNERVNLKVTGFGSSVFIEEGKECTDIVGSSYYVAPEVIRRRYGKEADVWSAGVILYILLSGAPPFSAPSEREVYDAILRGYIDLQSDPWPIISNNAKDLIRRMLTQDPKKRITAAQALEHPWTRECGSGTAFHEYLDNQVLPRLLRFKTNNKIKKMALKVIAEHLSEGEIEGLKQTFEKNDATKDGTITYKELLLAVVPLGTQLFGAEKMRQMKNVVEGSICRIDYNDFITAAMHRRRLESCEHFSFSTSAECSSSS